MKKVEDQQTEELIENPLPYAELTSDEMGNRDTVRKNSKNSDQVVSIELDKIVVREGFNVRNDYGDYKALGKSMLENGQTVPGRVDILADGTFQLTDGHRRFKALCWLRDQGNTDIVFKAIVNNVRMTEEDRIIQMFTTQDNKPLDDYEVAELFSRLVNLGWKQKDIQQKTGRAQSYISDMLSFAQESPVVKTHVKEGKIKASTVVAVKKTIKSQTARTAAIDTAVKKKTETPATGKPKTVTAEDITGKSKKDDIAKKLTKAIAGAFTIDDTAMLESIIKSYI